MRVVLFTALLYRSPRRPSPPLLRRDDRPAIGHARVERLAREPSRQIEHVRRAVQLSVEVCHLKGRGSESAVFGSHRRAESFRFLKPNELVMRFYWRSWTSIESGLLRLKRAEP